MQAITVQEAITRLNDEDYIFIDVREAQERSKLGVIPEHLPAQEACWSF
ncbi:hypothetical protein [Aliamphritea spongicola]|nr:hypothetical protein [Aliamphritea spongicola]